MRGEFEQPSLVAAAHEMKGSLALIRQLSLGLEGATLSPKQAELARRICLTSEQTLRLVTDLTRAQRLEDSLFELEPIHPLTLCEEVAHELTPLAREHQRELRVVRRRQAPLVVANRELLRRIMMQFVTNALQYADDDLPIELRTAYYGDRARIAVRDFGPGVSADVWRRLEGAGIQRQVIARRPESSGLGLYLSRQFAEAMSGKVGVTRHRDGASFFVDLGVSTQLSWL